MTDATTTEAEPTNGAATKPPFRARRVGKVRRIPLADLVRDPEINCRAGGVSERVAKEYRDALENGARFPPVVAFEHEGELVLADGFHRARAHELHGSDRIEVEVRRGTRRAALLHAVGANCLHGQPRSNADKRRAVLAMLGDDEWRKCSDRWIADQCAVSDTFVGKLRHELQTVGSSDPAPRRGKDGKVRKPKRARKTAKAKPTASLPGEPATPLDLAERIAEHAEALAVDVAALEPGELKRQAFRLSNHIARAQQTLSPLAEKLAAIG